MSDKKKKEKKPESRDKKFVKAIALAVILAAVSGVGVFFAINVNKETVYCFNNSYKAGDMLTKDMLTPIQVDKTIIVNGQKSNINSKFITDDNVNDILASGDKLRVDVGAGLFLTENTLVTQGGNAIENTMSSTALAITVKVDSTTGVTDDLRVGSRIDVICRLNGKTSVLEQIKVLSIDKPKGTINKVTLECSLEQAKVLAQANDEGYIHFALVGSGYQVEEQ